MKRRRTYRRAARQRWPGSRVFGAGPFAVLSPWPTSPSGEAVTLWYSETCARRMAVSVGRDDEFENGGFFPASVYDLSRWRPQR